MNSILYLNIETVLLQLKNTIQEIPENIFTLKSKLLSGASIGEHTRHILELYICLINQYEDGIVNYDKRERNIDIQTNVTVASNTTEKILNDIYKSNRKLILQSYHNTEEMFITIETNYLRELCYNYEHTIHHMAMIKIAINELCDYPLDENFGVAPSTIKYKKECAQ